MCILLPLFYAFACSLSFPVCILCSNYSPNNALMESFREKYFKERPNNFIYKDKTFEGTEEEYKKLLAESATLYVGGIKSSVTEERIWALFSIAGEIRRVIFGVNRNDLTPCGFCFVEFYERISAENAIKLFNGFRFDNSCLKCDIDYGFVNGRELGRGAYGGQVKSDIKRCKNV